VNDVIDTSILVAAMVTPEAHHEVCLDLITRGGCGIYLHGIVEAFNTLTGGRKGFRVPASLATELLEEDFVPQLTVATLTVTETLQAMREAESRGVRGGAIYDYLHLVAARKANAEKLFPLNVSNFLAFHRSGDPVISLPAVPPS
jgi:predicted nucleic acid-binding protein